MGNQSITISPLSLTNEQMLFILRAVYGPTLAFQPRETETLADMLERGYLAEHVQVRVNFPLLYLTEAGRALVQPILIQEEARRALRPAECELPQLSDVRGAASDELRLSW